LTVSRPLSDLENRAYEAGRSEEEQRAYERGRQAAEERLSRDVGWAAISPEPEVRQELAAPVPVRATGDRARWQRDTWGGRISRLFTPPDEAAELAAAKQLADQHELTYGSRPGLAQCLHKVRGSGTGPGTVLTGETAEVIGRIRLANPDQPIGMVVGSDPAASKVGGIVTGPGGHLQAHGDPGIAQATLEKIARQQQ
jgi:hypothetical protein